MFCVFQNSSAEDIQKDYFNNLKLLEAKKKYILLKIDFEKNNIDLKNLLINYEIPIGILKLDFLEEYSVPITEKMINEKKEVTIIGSDFYDGIGTIIKVSYKVGRKHATIRIESQFEELNLTFIPQLVPITIIKK